MKFSIVSYGITYHVEGRRPRPEGLSVKLFMSHISRCNFTYFATAPTMNSTVRTRAHRLVTALIRHDRSNDRRRRRRHGRRGICWKCEGVRGDGVAGQHTNGVAEGRSIDPDTDDANASGPELKKEGRRKHIHYISNVILMCREMPADQSLNVCECEYE